MNRRSIELQNDPPTIQFSTFRLKKSQIINYKSDTQFTISRNTNSLGLGLLIGYFINQSPESIKKVSLGQAIITQVPTPFITYQHQKTLHSLFNIVMPRILGIYSACDLINQYPISEFVLNCYLRCLAMNYLEVVKNGESNNIELMGNQQQIICDYSMDIRGNLLHLVALALDVHFTITYPDSNCQSYGNINSQILIQVSFNPINKYNFTIINQPTTKKIRQTYFRNVLNNPSNNVEQSNINETNSIAKENSPNLCHLCKKKGVFCECKVNNKSINAKSTMNTSFVNISPLNSAKPNFESQIRIINGNKQ